MSRRFNVCMYAFFSNTEMGSGKQVPVSHLDDCSHKICTQSRLIPGLLLSRISYPVRHDCTFDQRLHLTNIVHNSVVQNS